MIPFAFLPVITESWLILSSHFKTGREVVSNAGPSMKGQVIHPLGNPRLPTKPTDTLFPTDNRGALANTELLYKVVSELLAWLCGCMLMFQFVLQKFMISITTRDIINTVGKIISGVDDVHYFREIISAMEEFQYCGGYHKF